MHGSYDVVDPRCPFHYYHYCRLPTTHMYPYIHISLSLYIYICMMVNLLDGLRSAKFRNQRYWKMERGREREREGDLKDFCRRMGNKKHKSVPGHPMAGCSEEEAAGFLGT